MPDVIDDRYISLTTAASLPAVPRVERIGWGRVHGAEYRHQTLNRREVQAGIQVTLAGCGYVFTPRGGIAAEIPPGRALLFIAARQQVLYGAHPGAVVPWEFVYANISGGAALAMVGDLIAAHGHVLTIDPDHAAVRALRDQLAGRPPVVRRIVQAAGSALACDLLNALVAAQEPAGGADAGLVDQAMGWLSARLDRQVGVAEAAAACGVSREHLSRSFAALCGRPPAAWLRSQRLRRAETLLLGGALPVADIARRCGFASASAFIAAFRREYGVTAGRFRRGNAPPAGAG
jgi:AraC-like DNA-binding protein